MSQVTLHLGAQRHVAILQVKNLLLLSNMYPDKTQPSKGVFVRHVEQQLIEAGLTVDRIVVRNTQKNSRLAKIWAYLIFNISATSRMLRRKNPVYLHYVAHTSLPVILANTFRSQSVVAHAHGGDVISAPHQGRLIQRLKRFLSSRALGIADTIIVPSQFLADRIVNDFGISPKKMTIIPSGGVNTDIFQYRQRHTKGSHKGLHVGYVGRLDAGKGVETLIRAIHSFKLPIRCTIAGAGDMHACLSALVSKLELNEQITLLGACEQRGLAEIYRQLDFLVFPSELEESLGLVGLESMACGTPVIGSMRGGMAEYVVDKINGLAFEPGSAQSLVEALTVAYQMPSEIYANMCSNAYETSKAYDAKECAERLVQVFV